MTAGAWLLAVLYLVTTGFRPVGLSDGGLPPTTLDPAAAAAVGEPAPPGLSARAAVLVDEPSGQVLFAQEADRRLAMASTTKLMTALLVVETGRYFDTVTVEPSDLVGGSRMGLVSGDTLTVRDLLDGLLIPSGNDAAYALARHFGGRLAGPGGPVARFVAAMNARAAALGLTDTAFRNPEGLDVAGHYSSAADLAQLARVALRQPVIAQIVATPAVTVRGSRRAYALRTTNALLGSYPGALGVKTGTTDAAGECLIALVERDGRRVLAVVLGSSDRYADATALIDWGFANYRWLTPPPALAAAAAPPGWQATLLPGPPVAVPAAQVQFVQYRLRRNGPGLLTGIRLEVLVLDRTLARRPVSVYPWGRTPRPQPGW